MSTSGIEWKPVIRLFDAMAELAVTLHDAVHTGPIEECTDENCQKFRPKDNAQ